jgi:hypothetical protein
MGAVFGKGYVQFGDVSTVELRRVAAKNLEAKYKAANWRWSCGGPRTEIPNAQEIFNTLESFVEPARRTGFCSSGGLVIQPGIGSNLSLWISKRLV